MVDDSHAVGFTGDKGRGTHELNGVLGKIDILTGTLGKALGGASGGYVAAKKEIVTLLRQRARPYLFSNTLMPAIAHATLACLELLENPTARARSSARTAPVPRRDDEGRLHPRRRRPPDHPGDARRREARGEFAQGMLAEGIYVVGFSFPVVPQKQGPHPDPDVRRPHAEHLDKAIAAFVKVGKSLGVIK